MKIKTTYSVNDVVWINSGWGQPVQASVRNVYASARKTEDGESIHWYYQLIFTRGSGCDEKTDTTDKTDKEIYTTKLECVKSILGVEGSFDEALI